jgi:DNA repair protein RecN (Recombination protein N)
MALPRILISLPSACPKKMASSLFAGARYWGLLAKYVFDRTQGGGIYEDLTTSVDKDVQVSVEFPVGVESGTWSIRAIYMKSGLEIDLWSLTYPIVLRRTVPVIGAVKKSATLAAGATNGGLQNQHFFWHRKFELASGTCRGLFFQEQPLLLPPCSHLCFSRPRIVNHESRRHRMIKRLTVRNYAIIEELEINFPEGLTIITGETGAGKSILLGALGLIMGERADLKALYNEAEKCVVEGIFDVKPYNLNGFFQENDIDYEAECVVRRELTPSGKSRAFVNDTPVTLDVLRQLTGALVDLHEQFDTLDIHQVSFQLRMVDALAGNRSLLETYQSGYRQYTQDRKRLEKMKEQNARSAQELEFLNFQLAEFQKAELTEGEQERIEAEQQRLTHAEEIKRTLAAAFHYLCDGEQPLTGQLQDVVRSVSEVRKFHPAIPDLHRRLEGLAVELEDLAGEFEKVADSTEFDPGRIVEIQQRLDVIYRLQQKHRVASVKELLDIQATLQQQLDAIGDLSSDIERLEIEISKQEKTLGELARQLSEKRQHVAPAFTQKVLGLLAQLSMSHARFEVDFKTTANLTATGADEVNFLFAANPGSRLQLIKDVASGGELSRLTLVTKSLVASAIPLPTLIFDEIDAGVSGDVALKMGNILRQLSNHHQVVVITHSPQVAAKADAHYFVYKKTGENTTVTKVKLLDDAERVRSLAVMLSQNPPSEAALANARELIGDLLPEAP